MNFHDLTVLLVVATIWWAAKDWNDWVYMVLLIASGSCILSIIGDSIYFLAIVPYVWSMLTIKYGEDWYK